ncbi:DUF2345 domain-containing protein [Sulfuriferula nivalis]|uniref:DUF2345 domain-containing protein n=1 Tax=Sulfuriferula nivalis TaxID=2675298 RepID=UPI0022B7C776|nr:type VI secretion system Vgr family protein [Sulfuriferula nivalis]
MFDGQATVPDMPGGRALRFAGVRASDSTDAIDGFASLSQIRPTQVATSSWLPSTVVAPAGEASRDSSSALPSLAQYVDMGEQHFADTSHAATWADQQLLALAFDASLVSGQGAVRSLAPGFGFDLTGHDGFAAGANQFTLVSVRHEAVNNLGAGFQRGVGLADAEDGTYRNQFTAAPATTMLMPSASRRLPRPAVLGAQSALVVGLPDAVTTSTRDHQLRIQFHWQRGVLPNMGGLMDTGNSVDTTGHAPGNDQSGTWVRVAEVLAGENWGSVFTPRIGSEVLVDFIGGDIDRPVVTASLYNGVDTPPFAAGVDGGLDHAGVVSGWHSQNFSGDGFNQWLVDDAASELQMQLMSSTANSALNLGWLRSRVPASALRGTARGLGLEARTDAWGQLRGNAGAWLTTAQRSQSGASVTSTQLDVSEAADQLAAAASLNQTLRDAAVAQSAQVSDAALKSVPDLQLKLQPKADSAAAKALRFDAATVGLDSDASLNAATPQSMLLFAQGNLSWTTQGDSHLAAQHTVSVNSGDATTLFTHDGGMHVIAANAPVSLAAHTDAMEVFADQAINVTSTNNAILVEAQQKIVLQAGQSAIVLDGGNITFTCPGTFSVKGVAHQFSGGARDVASFIKLPDTRAKLFDEQLRAVSTTSGEPLTNMPYRIESATGEVFSGITNEEGKTERVTTADPESLKLFWEQTDATPELQNGECDEC